MKILNTTPNNMQNHQLGFFNYFNNLVNNKGGLGVPNLGTFNPPVNIYSVQMKRFGIHFGIIFKAELNFHLTSLKK